MESLHGETDRDWKGGGAEGLIEAEEQMETEGWIERDS